jgi:hypothetical protein
MATGIAALLYVAGLALGFSSFDAWDAAGSAKTIGVGSAVWMVLTWVAALFLGGMFASWFDGRNDDTVGAVHGLAVWGVSMVATAIWIACGLSMTMPPANNAVGMHARHGARTASIYRAATPASVAILDAHIARLASAGGAPGHDASMPITAALVGGHEDTASALLAAQSGTSQADAAAALSRLAPEIQSATRDAKAAADSAAHRLALTLWTAFVSALLALVASAAGGWLGAGHVHRVYHLRRYPDRSMR